MRECKSLCGVVSIFDSPDVSLSSRLLGGIVVMSEGVCGVCVGGGVRVGRYEVRSAYGVVLC